MFQQGGLKMSTHENDEPYDMEEMEKWLQHFFLDPLTSYYDQTQFRIDLFETENEWIVEALLHDSCSSDITVYVECQNIMITAKMNSDKSSRKYIRSIEFPFQINQQKITASFQNGILEIFISKKEQVHRKNRFITLP